MGLINFRQKQCGPSPSLIEYRSAANEYGEIKVLEAHADADSKSSIPKWL